MLLLTNFQQTCVALRHVGGRMLLRYYDLYQRLQLQFYAPLMMGAMYTRNMLSDIAVNKYLHTVASCWILLILRSISSLHSRKRNPDGPHISLVVRATNFRMDVPNIFNIIIAVCYPYVQKCGPSTWNCSMSPLCRLEFGGGSSI